MTQRGKPEKILNAVSTFLGDVLFSSINQCVAIQIRVLPIQEAHPSFSIWFLLRLHYLHMIDWLIDWLVHIVEFSLKLTMRPSWGQTDFTWPKALDIYNHKVAFSCLASTHSDSSDSLSGVVQGDNMNTKAFIAFRILQRFRSLDKGKTSLWRSNSLPHVRLAT